MNDPINMNLTVNELNLILEGLGNMPYVRVHELIHNIHSQAQEQVKNKTNLAAINNSNAHPAVTAGNGVIAD